MTKTLTPEEKFGLLQPHPFLLSKNRPSRRVLELMLPVSVVQLKPPITIGYFTV